MNIASYSLSVNVHCSVLIIFIALWTGGHVSTSVFWFAFTIWHIPCLYLKLKYLIETIDAVSSTMSFCKGINNNSINNQWGLSQFIRVAVALFRGMMPCRPNASFLVRMWKGKCGRRDLCLSWPRLSNWFSLKYILGYFHGINASRRGIDILAHWGSIGLNRCFSTGGDL